MTYSDSIVRTIKNQKTTGDKSTKIEVSRTRTTAGFSMIKLEVDAQTISFSSDTHGDSYEEIAREACQMLEDICNNYCEIPKGEDNE